MGLTLLQDLVSRSQLAVNDLRPGGKVLEAKGCLLFKWRSAPCNLRANNMGKKSPACKYLQATVGHAETTCDLNTSQASSDSAECPATDEDLPNISQGVRGCQMTTSDKCRDADSLKNALGTKQTHLYGRLAELKKLLNRKHKRCEQHDKSKQRLRTGETFLQERCRAARQ